MIRNCRLPITALCLLAAMMVPAAAQDKSRELELRLFNLNRGYLRPLSATAERLRALPTFKSLEPLGHSENITRFKIATDKSDAEIAAALGLKPVASGEGWLLLAPGEADPAAAEARAAILALVQAIRAKAEKLGAEPSRSMFDQEMLKDTRKVLVFLDLKEDFLDGASLKTADYHIEQSTFSGYTLWAGKAYQGVPVAGYEFRDDRATLDPDLSRFFVGCKLTLGRYAKGLVWVDARGFELNDLEFERTAEISRGMQKESAIVAGGKRVKQVLQAAARLRKRDGNEKKPAAELPAGFLSDYQLMSALAIKERDHAIGQQFPDDSLHLAWVEDTEKRVFARVRAHHKWHPLYLDGTLHADATLEEGEDALEKLQVKWTVAPEADASVFAHRREEADKAMAAVAEALFGAEITDVDKVCGGLGDADLRKRLNLDAKVLAGTHFSPADYSIERQLLGDVAVCVGGPATGGRRWKLVNLSAKKVIRTGQ